MRSITILLAITTAVCSASCRSQPAQPKPQPTGEVWRAWNTPDGQVHTEFVRNLTPEEAAGPHTECITATKAKQN